MEIIEILRHETSALFTHELIRTQSWHFRRLRRRSEADKAATFRSSRLEDGILCF